MPQALTVDDHSRVELPEVKPGEVLELEHPSPGVFVLRRTLPETNQAKPRLVSKNGHLVFTGGKQITSDDVQRMLEEFP